MLINNHQTQQVRNQTTVTLAHKKNDLIAIDHRIDELLMGFYQRASNQRKEIDHAVETLRTVADKANTAANDATKIADHALQTATNAAGIAAAKPLVEHFEDRIKGLKWPFGIWILGALVFFVSTVLFIIFVKNILDVPNPEKAGEVTLFISSKLIIVALLVGGMIWCGRLFRDAYDKRGFYYHKIAITKTYQVFMESTVEPDTKDAILNEALKHIFASPPSAHESPKAEIEIIKSLPDLIRAGEK